MTRELNRDGVLALCTNLPEAIEDYPFGDDVAEFKIVGKMFALVPLGGEPATMTLKCDPDWAAELRAEHAAFRPGYHTNKRHWNTIDLDGTVDDDELRDMITHSYDLVVKGLPRADRQRLGR